MKKYNLAAFILGTLSVSGIALCLNNRYWKNQSITIIGGADGPTSIFIAGKSDPAMLIYLITGLLILTTIIFFYLGRHKNKK